MTHGRDCPSKCSQCLGAAARQVAQDGSTLTIDGVPERQVDLPTRTNQPRGQRKRRGKR